MSLNNEFKIKNDSNTLGRILSGGVDIASILTTNTNLRTLTGTLLPTSIYQNASGNWQSTYLTVSALSALWGQGGTNIAAVTNYLSTNNVLISGLRITDNLTVVGSISTLNNGTSQQWNSTYTTVNTNSGNWNTAYNTATTYQLASSSFATNTLLQTTSGLLTPLTLTRTLTGQLVTTLDFSTYRTSVANSTATLLPTTIYQQTSGGFALSGYNTTISDTVSSVLVGGASPQAASVWKTRSIIQVLDAMLFPTLTASYTIPTLTISINPTTTQYEDGTIISPIFTGVFTKNDAGVLSALSFLRNTGTGNVILSTVYNPISGTPVATNVPDQFGYTNPNNPNAAYTLIYTDTNFQVTSATATWSVSAFYQDGLRKQNNKGDIDDRAFAVRSIAAPQLSSFFASTNTVSVVGRRIMFYGVDSTFTRAPSSSPEVRSLSLSTMNPAVNTAYDISIPIGATRIVYAYPASLGPANGSGSEPAFKDITANFDYTSNFTLTNVLVSGANGFTPVSYNVYTHVPASPIPGAFTMRMLI